MSDLETSATDVETTKPAHIVGRQTLTAALVVLAIPLAVIIAGIITTWWRPVTLVLICPVLKVMGHSKMAEPLAIRAVELYVHSDGLMSKHTMNALWNLAQVYVDIDKPAKAEPILRRIAAYNAKQQPESTVAPYQVLRAWSQTLRALGRTADADRIQAQVDKVNRTDSVQIKEASERPLLPGAKRSPTPRSVAPKPVKQGSK